MVLQTPMARCAVAFYLKIITVLIPLASVEDPRAFSLYNIYAHAGRRGCMRHMRLYIIWNQHAIACT